MKLKTRHLGPLCSLYVTRTDVVYNKWKQSQRIYVDYLNKNFVLDMYFSKY
jgi:hypothetical protein